MSRPSSSRPPRASRAVRLYAGLARLLLPGAVWLADGDEIVATFRQLLQERPTPASRLSFLLTCLAGLCRVAVLDHLDPIEAPTPRASRRTPRKDSPMTRWLQDVRFALRTLARSPTFTLGSVLLLGLGVGAVTGIFTLFDNVLLRPLPYPEPDRIVYVEDGSHNGPFWRAIQDTEHAGAWAASWTDQQNLTGQGEPRGLAVAQISEDFFRLFGARADEGRLLAPDDWPEADHVVLSHGFWLHQMGGDPDVVGRTLVLDGDPVTVVGVVERGFSPPEALTGREVELFRPLDWRAERFSDFGFHVLQVAGRLSPGSTPEQLREELQAVVTNLSGVNDHFRDREGNLWQVPVAPLREVTVRGVRAGLSLLLAAVGLLLLIACSNVAHLAIARGLQRTGEMSLRRALGASTSSLVRQLLVENGLVAMAGGLLGLGLAALSVRAFLTLTPSVLPRGEGLALDFRVVVFAVGISAATAIVFGLLPAVQTARRGRASSGHRWNTAGRSTGALRTGLVVAEVALSLVLLVGAGTLLRSFATVVRQDTGIVTENLWRVPLQPTDLEEPADYVARTAAIQQALESVPGVATVSYGLTLPFTVVGGDHCCWRSTVLADGDEEQRHGLSMHPVGSGFFETLGIPVVLGTPWQDGDAERRPIPVVLPQSTAASVFGSPEAAIGRTLEFSRSGDELEVVAIAADTRHYGLDQELTEMLYLPMDHIPFPIDLAEFAVRTTGPAPEGFADSLRRAVWRVAPNLPVPTVETLEQKIAEGTAARRFDSLLFGAFGVVALLLAAAGLYGTLLYAVGQRRREMGIRIALGAARRNVEGHILRSGALVSLAGIGLGLAGAWLAGRFLESRIWGVEARDPASLVGATLLLFLVALLASWIPARRAGRTDPVETLRAD